MKIKIKNKNTKESKITYPCLMSYKDNDQLIVLFTDTHTGVVLRTNDINNPVGAIENDWVSQSFKPFKGKITLSND